MNENKQQSNMDNLSYESIIQLMLKNMNQLSGNTISSCNIMLSNYVLLKSLKNRTENDKKIKQESKEEILMQIDETSTILENSKNVLFSNLSCLKSQLESYRFIYNKMKENGVIQGDVSVLISQLEKSLSIKEVGNA